jgi:hypothetical protein
MRRKTVQSPLGMKADTIGKVLRGELVLTARLALPASRG